MGSLISGLASSVGTVGGFLAKTATNGLCMAGRGVKTIGKKVVGVPFNFIKSIVVQKVSERVEGLAKKAVDTRIREGLESTVGKIQAVSVKKEVMDPTSKASKQQQSQFLHDVACTLEGADRFGAKHPHLAKVVRKAATKVGSEDEVDDLSKAAKDYQTFMEAVVPLLQKVLTSKNMTSSSKFLLDRLTKFTEVMAGSNNKFRDRAPSAEQLRAHLAKGLGTAYISPEKGLASLNTTFDDVLKLIRSTGGNVPFFAKLGLNLLCLLPSSMQKNLIDGLAETFLSILKQKLGVTLLPFLQLMNTSIHDKETLDACIDVLFWSIVPSLIAVLFAPAISGESGSDTEDVDASWHGFVDQLMGALSDVSLKKEASLTDLEERASDVTGSFVLKDVMKESTYEQLSRFTDNYTVQDSVKTIFGDGKGMFQFMGRMLKRIQPSRIIPGITGELSGALLR